MDKEIRSEYIKNLVQEKDALAKEIADFCTLFPILAELVV